MNVPPIAGVPTSTAGFVGWVGGEAPPEPLLVTGWRHFEREVGTGGGGLMPHNVRSFFEEGGRRLYVSRVARGGDLVAGLARLAPVDEMSLLCVPDAVHPSLDWKQQRRLHSAIARQCRSRRRFAVLAVPRGERDPRPPVRSSYAAVYHPWVKVATGGARGRYGPPVGAVAGVYARIDRSRGVHTAPAGVAARLKSVTGLDRRLSAAERARLQQRRVNPLRELGSGAFVVWGARTAGSDLDYVYVSVRRLGLFVEESIVKGTEWVVFEPNAEPLWAALRRSIEAFLGAQWRRGALAGSKPEEAFFVRVDRTTMTQDDIDDGRVVALVGFAPLRPAEFVVLHLGWQTR